MCIESAPQWGAFRLAKASCRTFSDCEGTFWVETYRNFGELLPFLTDGYPVLDMLRHEQCNHRFDVEPHDGHLHLHSHGLSPT